MSSTYLNSRLRYNYFRFWTINVRHIGISPTVSFLTFHRNRCVVVSKSGQPLRKYDVISIFQDGCRGDLILFPVSCLLMSLLQKVKKYLQTKFCRHGSIHGWAATTSALEKQTSAIMKYYFRFRSQPLHRNRRVILHRAAKFRPNRTTHCGNMRIWKEGAMVLPIRAGNGSRRVTHNRMTHLNCDLWVMTHCIKALKSSHTYARVYSHHKQRSSAALL